MLSCEVLGCGTGTEEAFVIDEEMASTEITGLAESEVLLKVVSFVLVF